MSTEVTWWWTWQRGVTVIDALCDAVINELPWTRRYWAKPMNHHYVTWTAHLRVQIATYVSCALCCRCPHVPFLCRPMHVRAEGQMFPPNSGFSLCRSCLISKRRRSGNTESRADRLTVGHQNGVVQECPAHPFSAYKVRWRSIGVRRFEVRHSSVTCCN